MIIRGVVIRGRNLGHKLGFPTANIAIKEPLEQPNGVYRSRVIIAGQSFKAVSNLGVKPSVGGGARLLETHIIDFSQDIYGQEIEVDLREKLRDEQHFDSLEALTEQIKIDVEKVKTIIK